MAVFLNRERRAFALLSYKAMYSRFLHSPQWEYLGEQPTPRMLARSLVKHRIGSACQIVRHPESRFISFFMDKFRIQPSLWRTDGFEWQPCHLAFLPVIGKTQESTRREIASAFLSMPFSQLLEALPRYYALDSHTWPQTWTGRMRVGARMTVKWPGLRKIRMEDGMSALADVPDIDFSEKTNPSSYKHRDFVITSDHRAILNTLYASDYELGSYDLNGPSGPRC